MPPLTEKSPGCVTKSTLENSYSNNISLIKSIDNSSSTLIFKVFLCNSVFVITFSNSAL